MRKINAKLIKSRWWLIFTILALLAGGCSQVREGRTVAVATPDLFGIGENLASQLISNRRSSFGLGDKLIFTTVVNLNDLYQTSKFGRALSESLATRLFNHGYGVVELRKMSGLLMKNHSGELALSRETGRLAKEHNANAIVAGTYSMTPKSIIVNIKVLDAVSQDVLSVAGLEIKRSSTINYLLADGGPVIDMLSGDENF